MKSYIIYFFFFVWLLPLSIIIFWDSVMLLHILIVHFYCQLELHCISIHNVFIHSLLVNIWVVFTHKAPVNIKFRSVIWVNFLIWWEVWIKFGGVSAHAHVCVCKDIQLVLHHFLKKLSSTELLLYLCQKLVLYIPVSLFLGSLLCSCDLFIFSNVSTT